MMLPTDLDMRAVLGPEAISYSELSTLAQCEEKWRRSYTGTREQSQPSAAMRLGSEIHRLVQAWWQTGEVLDSDDETAARLIDRYSKHYADNRDRAELISIEQPFCVPLPWDGWLFGYWDMMLRIDGALWIGEIKSMGQNNMLWLSKSRQLTLYHWAAQQSGLDPAGVLLDGIVTTKVPKLLREWITPEEDTLDEAIRELYSASLVRRHLRSSVRVPIKSISTMTCRGCFHATDCHGLGVELLAE